MLPCADVYCTRWGLLEIPKYYLCHGCGYTVVIEMVGQMALGTPRMA